MSRQWKNTIRIGDIADEARDRAASGLLTAVEHVLQVSNTLVPIEEATLERSGTASVDEDKLIGAVSYDTPYAVRQHEEMDYEHDDGRQAKYLETAMNSQRQQVRRILIDAIDFGS